MHEDIEEKITIPEGVEAKINTELVVKGPKGELKRAFPCKLEIKEKEVILKAKKATKNEKKIIKTSKAHINNMIKGVSEGFGYTLQICSVHFPMSVSVENGFVVIKNFLGETKERKAPMLPSVEVKVEGDLIKVFSADKEAAGQTAANIELATKIRNRDKRIFQDGIWIIEKAGKKLLE